jgi:hypothetical protein
VGFDPQKRFTDCDKAGDVENGVWCELMKLHTVDEKKPAKELVGRKRQTAQEKVKKYHPKAAQGLGDALSARKNDLIVGRDEAIVLGFLQIPLLENRWHPAGCGVRGDVLAHLVFLRASLDAHLWAALGGYAEAQKGAGSATMAAAAEAR